MSRKSGNRFSDKDMRHSIRASVAPRKRLAGRLLDNHTAENAPRVPSLRMSSASQIGAWIGRQPSQYATRMPPLAIPVRLLSDITMPRRRRTPPAPAEIVPELKLVLMVHAARLARSRAARAHARMARVRATHAPAVRFRVAHPHTRFPSKPPHRPSLPHRPSTSTFNRGCACN